MKKFVGVDLGGTNMICGVMDRSGGIIHKRTQPTEAHLGADHVVSRIVELIQLTVQESQHDMEEDIAAVGIGVPGLVDPVQGLSLTAANLKWKNIPVAERVSKAIGKPVNIDNDVRMYTFGEATVGSGRDAGFVLGLTLGTGLAAALVADGDLYYGGGFLAGELGHIQFPDIPYDCNCGKTGCLETIASATGLLRQLKERWQESERAGKPLPAYWQDKNIDEVTAADISIGYDHEDPWSIDIMQHTGDLLGRGLSYASVLLSPDKIIIGGGVAAAGERLFASVRKRMESDLLAAYWERIKIVQASLGDDAGIIGSALSAAKQHKHS